MNLKRFRNTVLAMAALMTTRGVMAQNAPPAAPADNEKPKVYVVGYAHLDTQWRWSYPQVISEFLLNTLHDNFKYFPKYPNYVFNFTGAYRYMLFAEYYPNEFKQLQQYVKEGKWFPGGSSLEEGDANMPSGEAMIRQVLYGNEFFRKEFGKASEEFMLPDTFGFQASLPSLLAHCGLKGFSTQKLTWGSAVGIPFNVGVWKGLDGREIVAALNPGSYGAALKEDIANDPKWIKRLEDDKAKQGVAVDYHYYGTGDRGGAPGEDSLKMLEKVVAENGAIKVISSTAEQMFVELTPQQIEKLPRYQGDFLLTNHSAGSLTSQAFVKRMNRKGEELCEAAETAATMAAVMTGKPYPADRLRSAWTLLLVNHFHDIMAGTALPKAYEYVYNQMFIGMNQASEVLTDSVNAIASTLDTRGGDAALVAFNPLSAGRTDVIEATIPFKGDAAKLTVSDADGKALPTQVLSHENGMASIAVLAPMESWSVDALTVKAGESVASSELSMGDRTIENKFLKVTISDAGEIESVFDKQQNKQVLTGAVRMSLHSERPKQYPAWNMDWEDRQKPAKGFVSGPCEIKQVESGPVRNTIEISRDYEGSHYVQRVSLVADSPQVDVSLTIDWRTPRVSLKADFPLGVSNPMATYETQSAAIDRGNNNDKKFETPQQQWFNVDDTSGKSGVAILNDCKYGSDKPDDATVRLTLLYTPAIRDNYQDQGSQDFGHHEMRYAILPHAGKWSDANVPAAAKRFNQPIRAFVTDAHEGSGKHVSLGSVSSDHVRVMALKQAEDGKGYIVRFNETAGKAEPATELLKLTGGVTSMTEVDGQERPIQVAQQGGLVGFGLKTVRLQLPAKAAAQPKSASVDLAFNADVVSSNESLKDGVFDQGGRTYPAINFPKSLDLDGMNFKLGSTDDKQNNAVRCEGQTINLPAGDWKRVSVIMSAADGDADVTFKIGDTSVTQHVLDWASYLAQWDTRQWRGPIPVLTYKWRNPLAGVQAGYTKRDEVAWFSSHRHDPEQGTQFYHFCYLFKYDFDLPKGATSITLPDEKRAYIFAATVSDGSTPVKPAMPLYDTLEGHPSWKVATTQPTSEPTAPYSD